VLATMTRDARDTRQDATSRRLGGSALRALRVTKSPDKFKDSVDDIRFFAKFCGLETGEQVEELILGPTSTQEKTQKLVTDYRDDLRAKGLAYGTINRRLTAIRTLIRMAKLIGMVSWDIDVSAGDRTLHRDTRGVNKSVLVSTSRRKDDTPQVRRDKAIVTLAHHGRLNRAEIVSLPLENYDPNPESPTVTVGGRAVELTKAVKKSLDRWIEVRGFKGSLLFTQHDDRTKPMTAAEIIALVRPGSVLS
jgi:integrase/recombinase XerC